jgi:para-aminobenzoate synthetase/4-amino-4-deoxychorismate lyase
MPETVILHDARRGGWLAFRKPVAVVAAITVGEVLPALRTAEALVNGRGLHAAGFVSYEAAPGFDATLKVRGLDAAGDGPSGRLNPGRMPLLWFGLYDGPEWVAAPEAGEDDPAETPTRDGDAVGAAEAWVPSVSREEYAAALKCIKEQIAEGNTYQVNYTFRLRRRFAGDAAALFARLARAQQAQYAAYVDVGRWRVCSASPELFFRRDGRRLMTRPMKGTATRGLTPAEDRAQAEWLRQSEKNQAENVMIVDMLRNDLGRVAEIGSVRVPRLFELERYPNVWQMTSTVTAETDAPLAEVMQALFPCASITGAPKHSTMNLIARLESTPRGVYTGCIGHFGPGQQAQFNVAIRTVVVDRDAGGAEFGVGGGIVWDSETEAEYDECLAKARVLSAPAASFELFESLRWRPEEGFFLLDQHLRRLGESAEYFGFRFERETAAAQLAAATAGRPGPAQKVRLFLEQSGRMRSDAQPMAWPAASSLRVGLAKTPVDPNDKFLYHKTTRREVYAAALAAFPDCDDVVLWNARGEVTETCHGSVVARVDGKRITPPLTSGLLPGTFRAWLLEQGEVEEGVLRVEDLTRYEGLWRVNSVRGWQRMVVGNGD